MNKIKYFELQKKAGLSNAQASAYLGISISTIKRYRNGQIEAPKTVIMCLENYIDKMEQSNDR